MSSKWFFRWRDDRQLLTREVFSNKQKLLSEIFWYFLIFRPSVRPYSCLSVRPSLPWGLCGAWECVWEERMEWTIHSCFFFRAETVPGMKGRLKAKNCFPPFCVVFIPTIFASDKATQGSDSVRITRKVWQMKWITPLSSWRLQD